jgi:hypothetical protein
VRRHCEAYNHQGQSNTREHYFTVIDFLGATNDHEFSQFVIRGMHI